MCLLMEQMARMDATHLANPVSTTCHQTKGLWTFHTKDAVDTPSIVFLLSFFHPLLKFVLYSARPHLCSCSRLLTESAWASALWCCWSRRGKSLDGGRSPLVTPMLR